MTLVNLPRKQTKSDESKSEFKREFSPAAGENMDLQLLEEELDNIDSPMAGAGVLTKNIRPNQLSLNVNVKTSNDDNLENYWKLMDISYRIPLFDMDLNSAITTK